MRFKFLPMSVAVVLMWATVCLAEPPVSPPDVVMLSDGGMVRGTISEKVAGDYVIIITMQGETRRFDLSEVEYAGPAGGAPPPQTPEQPDSGAPSTGAFPLSTEPSVPSAESAQNADGDEPGTSSTWVTADVPKLRLFVRSGAATGSFASSAAVGLFQLERYDDLCELPCDVHLEPGTYRFAVKRPSFLWMVRIRESVTIEDGTPLVVDYRSRLGVRVAGLLAFLGGLGGGMALILDGLNASCPECDAPQDKGKTTTGVVLVSVGGAALFLLFVPDGATISRGHRGDQSLRRASVLQAGSFSGER